MSRTHRMQATMALLAVLSLLVVACAPGPGQIGGQGPTAQPARASTPTVAVDMPSVEECEGAGAAIRV